MELSIDTIEDFDRMLRQRKTAFLEAWVGRDQRNLAVLVNGDRGWLTLFRYDGDGGLWTYNPDCNSDEDMPFQLGNGQLDHYPEYYCVSVSELRAAIEHFLKTGDADPGLNWTDEI